MKKTLSLIIVAVVAIVLLGVAIFVKDSIPETISESGIEVENEDYYAQFRDQNITLNVYNWGEYISDGSEGSVDVIKEFEAISGIKVTYTTFETNEDLYAKLSSSNSQYDIIIPSDYMIARMIEEDMVEKIDFENIPNISKINPEFRYTSFDPEGQYSVPYTWGAVGVVYNTKYVDNEDTGSWDLLWNEKYAGNILMFSNSRDAIGIALKKLNYSLNSENPKEIEEAAEALKEQQNVNQAYVMDQVLNKMESESAYIAPYYAGECMQLMKENHNLDFYYPKEGFNVFIDSICIPKGSKNKKAAEAFINFLCETDVAVANCEYICYFSPHIEAASQISQNVIYFVDDTDADYGESIAEALIYDEESGSGIDGIYEVEFFSDDNSFSISHSPDLSERDISDILAGKGLTVTKTRNLSLLIQPSEEMLNNKQFAESYTALPNDINSLYDSKWIEVRSRLDISEIAIVAIILGLALAVLIVLTILRKMKKGKINY